MNVVVGDLLMLVTVIALSPFSLIASAMFGNNDRRLGFLIGHFLGVAVMLLALEELMNTVPNEASADTRPIAGAVLIMLGALLLVLAVKKLAGMKQSGEGDSLPGWAEGIDALSFGRSLLLGVMLAALNPKNILVIASAATIVGGDDWNHLGMAWIAFGFSLIATLPHIVTYVGMAVWPTVVAPHLETSKAFLLRHNAAIAATVLILIGVNVIGKGISLF